MAGKILIAGTGFDPHVWRAEFARKASGRSVITTLSRDADDVEYAVVWKQREGILNRLPNLKAIFSLGAGVDHIFHDDSLPDVPIVRVVAKDLTARMSEYVVWQVLDHHRKGPLYRRQQQEKLWQEDRNQPAAGSVTVGILGLGKLGIDAAAKLTGLGFQVTGWSRTAKQIDGVKSFHGDDQRDSFLGLCDILVCLLPLTEVTRGILSMPLFNALKQDGPLGAPILINAGRGGLQVESDIIAALDEEILGAAALDVFEAEPLPAENPLWNHPKITITPHAAAASDPASLVPTMVAQMNACDRGEALKYVVDRDAGY